MKTKDMKILKYLGCIWQALMNDIQKVVDWFYNATDIVAQDDNRPWLAKTILIGIAIVVGIALVLIYPRTALVILFIIWRINENLPEEDSETAQES